jgi:chromosome segregation ATPase
MEDKQPQEGNPTGQAPAATDTPKTTATPPTGQAPENVDALPDWAKSLFAELRAENAAHRKAKQKADEEAKAAEEQRLEAERKFEQLAQQRAARVAELEPIAERYNALAAKLTADLEAQIEKLPAEIKQMKPATADLDDLIDWAEKARQLAAKMQAAASPGHGAAPKAADATARPALTQAQAIAAMRSKF